MSPTINLGKPSIAAAIVALLALCAWPAHSQTELLPEVNSLETEALQLLDRMDRSIRDGVIQSENTLKAEIRIIDTIGDSNADVPLGPDIEARRKQLLAQVTEWSRESIVVTELTLTAQEINSALAQSEEIAEFYGLDMVRMHAFYEAGRRLIREGDFERPGEVPPHKEENLVAYFRDLFIYAHAREKAIQDYRARNQRYRLGLHRKLTFAYMRALLSSGEPPLPCPNPNPTGSTTINGVTVPVLGCPDPVVQNLRAYVNAIRQIQSADADTYLAEAERVVAQQQLAADFMAVVPVVGEVIDLYSVISGEGLAGNCLSRFEKGLTTVFLAVPILGPKVVSAVVKRSPAAAEALQRLALYLDSMAEHYGDVVEGVAARWGVSRREFETLRHALVDTEIRVEGVPGWSVAARREWVEKLDNNEFLGEFLRRARAGTAKLNEAPEALLRQARARANNIVRANLDAVQGTRSAVIEAGGLVPRHVDAIEQLAKARNEIYIFRNVNPDARRLIEMDFATKGMNVKGKSADWGPHAGFIPVDQKFSKMGNPSKGNAARIDAREFGEIKKFHDKVSDCVARRECISVDAVMPDGGRIMTVPDPRAGREMPVTFRDGKYFDADGTAIALTPDQIARQKPMQVLAANGPDGVPKPLTADYDFLAFGLQGRQGDLAFKEGIGFIGKREAEAMAQVNSQVNLAGYKGGKISHHGSENLYPGTPGALGLGEGRDRVVTAIDPELGAVTLPVCDAKCMQRWCDTSRQCGGLKVCAATPVMPCVPVDPDRMAKDFFHSRRLAGYHLTPNPRWNWGTYNVLGGWTAEGFLKEGIVGQLRLAQRTLVRPEIYRAAYQSMVSGLQGVAQYAFKCPNKPTTPSP